MYKLMAMLLFFGTPSFAQNYADVQKFIRQVEKDNPITSKVFQLGKSDQGNIIEGLTVGSGSAKALIVGTHHGNEYGSTEVAKAMAKSLAESPIKDLTVYVIPVLNASGYTKNSRYEIDSTGRSRDPNRDYPGPCGTDGPFKLKSTAALASFIEKEQIVISATLHTYSPAVVYPWGISTHDIGTPYDDIFIRIAESAVVESKYEVGNSTVVMYPADGTFEDYAYWKLGSWSLLFELGYSHTPSQSAVQEMVKVNVPGIRRFLEQAPNKAAEKHEFTGKCDRSLRVLDRRDE